jgi:hypothetical protein
MRRIIQLVVLFALLSSSANATQRLIVSDLLGQSLLNLTYALLGCNVLGGLNDPLAQLFLIGVPDTLDLNTLIPTLLSVTGIVDAEVNQLLTIFPALPNLPPIPPGLGDTIPVTYYGASAWRGYTNQPAAQIWGFKTLRILTRLQGPGS